MIAPGPDAVQLKTILSIATRVPDHGKLAPWRFVVVMPEQRTRFAALLHEAYRRANAEPGRLEIEAIDAFAHQAPTLVVVLSSPDTTSKIPLWEQELSVGAATMNLLSAAHASGFVAGWLTGWAAYDDHVRAAFAEPHERIAGFVFIGTPSRPLEDRPRPDRDTIVRVWD